MLESRVDMLQMLLYVLITSRREVGNKLANWPTSTQVASGTCSTAFTEFEVT